MLTETTTDRKSRKMPGVGSERIDLPVPFEYCGKALGRWFDVKTGILTSFVMWCNDYYGCRLCRQRRLGFIAGRIERALSEHGDVTIEVVSSREASCIQTFVGKDNVFRVPQDDGTVVVFMRNVCVTGHARVSRLRPTMDELEEIVRHIPRGKGSPRVTGDLGKRPRGNTTRTRDHRENGQVKIETARFMLGKIEGSLENTILQDVAEELGPPDASSRDALQAHVDLVMMRSKEQFRAAGAHIAMERRVSVKVDLSDVCW